jgi:hypothetical protein
VLPEEVGKGVIDNITLVKKERRDDRLRFGVDKWDKLKSSCRTGGRGQWDVGLS